MMTPSKERLKQQNILPYKVTSEDEIYERTEPPKMDKAYIYHYVNMLASYLNETFIEIVTSETIKRVMTLHLKEVLSSKNNQLDSNVCTSEQCHLQENMNLSRTPYQSWPLEEYLESSIVEHSEKLTQDTSIMDRSRDLSHCNNFYNKYMGNPGKTNYEWISIKKFQRASYME
eukprot:13069624-Ditylum_brightwellii.AAC.1